MPKIKYSLNAFKNEFVEVVTLVQISSSANNEESFVERVQPMIIAGIFLSHDKENVYLGDEDGRLSDVLLKSQIAHIGVSKKRDHLDELMDGTVLGGNN